jgi:hypothetical protein
MALASLLQGSVPTTIPSTCYVGLLTSLRLFVFPTFLFAAQPKKFFLDGLKKLEHRRHKCVELRGEYVELIHVFNPIACFLYKVKDLSASPCIFPLRMMRNMKEQSLP